MLRSYHVSPAIKEDCPDTWRDVLPPLLRPTVVVLLLCLACGGLACSDSFPPPSRVESLRILAIQSEPPELWPGEAGLVTPLVVSPAASGPEEGLLVNPSSLQYQWRACILALPFIFPSAGSADQGDSLPTDADERSRDLLEALANPPPSCFEHDGEVFQIPLLPGEEPHTATIAIPDVTFPPEIGRMAIVSGIWITVSLRVSNPLTDETVTGNKRVVIKPSEADRRRGGAPDADEEGAPLPDLCVQEPSLCARNTNPSAPALEDTSVIDNHLLILQEEGELELAPAIPWDEMESYVDMVGFASLEEVLQKETYYYSWFTSVGRFSPDKTLSDPAWPLAAQSTMKANSGDSAGEAGPLEIFMVVRDGRGGTAWTRYRL